MESLAAFLFGFNSQYVLGAEFEGVLKNKAIQTFADFKAAVEEAVTNVGWDHIASQPFNVPYGEEELYTVDDDDKISDQSTILVMETLSDGQQKFPVPDEALMTQLFDLWKK